MRNQIRNNVIVERAKLRITQQELANEVGSSRQTIHLLETGKTDPKISLIIKIANFFKVKVSDIIEY